MSTEREKKITVMDQGPFRVQGDIPVYWESLVLKSDGSYAWEKRQKIETPKGGVMLCRCGKTRRPPFCDGSHKAGFAGKIHADYDTISERAILLEGPGLNILDDVDLCSWSRFCHTADGKVWSLLDKSGDPDVKRTLVKACQECPSGRLTPIDKESGQALEPKLKQEIVVTQDSEKHTGGPLVVRGGIPLEDNLGRRFEVRNRQTLCRCGHSHNTPFCDGRHATTECDDGNIGDS